MNAVERVAQRIEAGESAGVMSCGEQIAAALIYNRMDWLPSDYNHVLDAIDRLGTNWFAMVMEYRKDNS